MDHIAFRVPVLILAIAENFDELLQDGRVTAVTPLGKLGGIMEMAVDLALMLVVGILRTKNGRAHGAGEMFNVIFAIQGCDIGATQSTTTLMTKQI